MVNLRQPAKRLLVQTAAGPLVLDMREVAKRFPDLDPGDVLSVGGYRNAKGDLVPDYDSVRIEKQHGGEE